MTTVRGRRRHPDATQPRRPEQPEDATGHLQGWELQLTRLLSVLDHHPA